MKIAICAPSAPLAREDAARVMAIAADYPGLELVFHEQCFAVAGHFAGDDAARLEAFVACANDPGFDAVWFARGGYGAARIAERAVNRLNRAALNKQFLGYSDGGTLLAALYRAGIGRPVHAPMPRDVIRDGGDEAVRRALDWLAGSDAGLEPSLGQETAPVAAFNLMTLAMLTGTRLMPDLGEHVVMVEEVSEHLYAVDRLLFHVTANLARLGVAALRLGRVSQVPENDRPFGAEPEAMIAEWCARTGIAYAGRAEIGHDADNRIVPFGLAR